MGWDGLFGAWWRRKKARRRVKSPGRAVSIERPDGATDAATETASRPYQASATLFIGKNMLKS
jgi:hypothetical protein